MSSSKPGSATDPRRTGEQLLELTAAEVESVLPADREASSRRRTHAG